MHPAADLARFLQLLRGYRPPRLLCFVCGAAACAWLTLTWLTTNQPISVIRECEHYRHSASDDVQRTLMTGV